MFQKIVKGIRILVGTLVGLLLLAISLPALICCCLIVGAGISLLLAGCVLCLPALLGIFLGFLLIIPDRVANLVKHRVKEEMDREGPRPEEN